MLREKAGLSIREVAARSGVPVASAGDYFSGKHLPPSGRPEVLTSILSVLGVTAPADAETWLRVLNGVRRLPGQRGPAPYRGLASYQPEEAKWFHGRSALTEHLVTRLADEWTAGSRLLVVVGPSGSGKSSLLRAGLLPAIQAGALGQPEVASWPVVLLTPGEHPLAELAVRTSKDGEEAPGWVLVVDQFEEVFTACADEIERRAFIDRLARLADERKALVVLGMRADFYGHALRHPRLAQAMREAQVVVSPMTEPELRDAIVTPARLAKMDLEPGLVELVLRDLQPSVETPPETVHDLGSLPMMSHALLATWQRAQRGVMTVADYRDCGGIRGSVALTAETVFQDLSDEEQRFARRTFVRLVHVGHDTADTRRRASRDRLVGADETVADDVLERFIDQRLITVDADSVEITHEALIQAWPRLRSWISEDRVSLRSVQVLEDAADAWIREARDPAALYTGTRLAAARDSLKSVIDYEATPLAEEFVAASIGRDRRRIQRVYQVMAGLVVLLLVAATAGVIAFQQRSAATHERNLAISRLVAARAERLRGTDVSLAMQLNLAAYKIAPTLEARSGLLDSSALVAATRMLGSADIVHAVAVNGAGHLLAAGGADRAVRLWDITDPHTPRRVGEPLAGPTARVTTLGFHPVRPLLAVGSADKKVRLWDISGKAPPIESAVISVSGEVTSIAFSPDGSLLAVGSSDHTITVWYLADPAHPTVVGDPLTGPTDDVTSVAFSPSGKILACASTDKAVYLWNVAGPARPTVLGTPLTGTTGTLNAIAFSPDGLMLAAGGTDRSVRRWDLSNPEQPIPAVALTGPESWIYGIAYAPDGHSLAAISADNTAYVWDTATGQVSAKLPHPGPVTAVTYLTATGALFTGAADGVVRMWTLPGPILTGPARSVFTVAFHPQEPRLAVASGDETVRLWDITNPRNPARQGQPLRAVDGHLVGTVAFGPHGRLAAGRDDGTVQLWDVTDAQHPVSTTPASSKDRDVVESVFFSPNGKLLATGREKGTVQLWDVSNMQRPTVTATLATTPGKNVYSVAFSPDGKILAAGGADDLVRLWDVTNSTSPIQLGKPLAGPAGTIYHVLFSPNGRILATGSTDGSVWLWDVTDPSHPKAIGKPLTGPKGFVYSVAFAPDGNTLATANTDKTVWLWNIATPDQPSPVAVLTGPANTVFSVAFAPDGHTLAAGSQDKTVRLWETDPENVAAFICGIAGDRITEAEWKQYVQALPYNPPCD